MTNFDPQKQCAIITYLFLNGMREAKIGFFNIPKDIERYIEDKTCPTNISNQIKHYRKKTPNELKIEKLRKVV